MATKTEILRLIQSHKVLQPFDYKLAVDWSIDLIKNGNETDNVLMLASFSQPIDREEITPYISAVLKDLNLKELDYQSGLVAQTHFLLLEILNDSNIRKNLYKISQICVNSDFESSIMDFYLLHHGWKELEEMGVNLYYEGADLNNIESILKTKAEKWIDKYIYGKKDEPEELIKSTDSKTEEIKIEKPKESFISKLKKIFS